MLFSCLSRRFKTAALRPRMESVGISPEGQAGKKPRALARELHFPYRYSDRRGEGLLHC